MKLPSFPYDYENSLFDGIYCLVYAGVDIILLILMFYYSVQEAKKKHMDRLLIAQYMLLATHFATNYLS